MGVPERTVRTQRPWHTVFGLFWETKLTCLNIQTNFTFLVTRIWVFCFCPKSSECLLEVGVCFIDVMYFQFRPARSVFSLSEHEHCWEYQVEHPEVPEHRPEALWHRLHVAQVQFWKPHGYSILVGGSTDSFSLESLPFKVSTGGLTEEDDCMPFLPKNAGNFCIKRNEIGWMRPANQARTQ